MCIRDRLETIQVYDPLGVLAPQDCIDLYVDKAPITFEEWVIQQRADRSVAKPPVAERRNCWRNRDDDLNEGNPTHDCRQPIKWDGWENLREGRRFANLRTVKRI